MTLRGGQESTFDLGGKEKMWLKQFMQELISRATGYLANYLFLLNWQIHWGTRVTYPLGRTVYSHGALFTDKQILLRTQLEISFHLLCSLPAFNIEKNPGMFSNKTKSHTGMLIVTTGGRGPSFRLPC